MIQNEENKPLILINTVRDEDAIPMANKLNRVTTFYKETEKFFDIDCLYLRTGNDNEFIEVFYHCSQCDPVKRKKICSECFMICHKDCRKEEFNSFQAKESFDCACGKEFKHSMAQKLRRNKNENVDEEVKCNFYQIHNKVFPDKPFLKCENHDMEVCVFCAMTVHKFCYITQEHSARECHSNIKENNLKLFELLTYYYCEVEDYFMFSSQVVNVVLNNDEIFLTYFKDLVKQSKTNAKFSESNLNNFLAIINSDHHFDKVIDCDLFPYKKLYEELSSTSELTSSYMELIFKCLTDLHVKRDLRQFKTHSNLDLLSQNPLQRLVNFHFWAHKNQFTLDFHENYFNEQCNLKRLIFKLMDVENISNQCKKQLLSLLLLLINSYTFTFQEIKVMIKTLERNYLKLMSADLVQVCLSLAFNYNDFVFNEMLVTGKECAKSEIKFIQNGEEEAQILFTITLEILSNLMEFEDGMGEEIKFMAMQLMEFFSKSENTYFSQLQLITDSDIEMFNAKMLRLHSNSNSNASDEWLTLKNDLEKAINGYYAMEYFIDVLDEKITQIFENFKFTAVPEFNPSHHETLNQLRIKVLKFQNQFVDLADIVESLNHEITDSLAYSNLDGVLTRLLSLNKENNYNSKNPLKSSRTTVMSFITLFFLSKSLFLHFLRQENIFNIIISYYSFFQNEDDFYFLEFINLFFYSATFYDVDLINYTKFLYFQLDDSYFTFEGILTNKLELMSLELTGGDADLNLISYYKSMNANLKIYIYLMKYIGENDLIVKFVSIMKEYYQVYEKIMPILDKMCHKSYTIDNAIEVFSEVRSIKRKQTVNIKASETLSEMEKQIILLYFTQIKFVSSCINVVTDYKVLFEDFNSILNFDLILEIYTKYELSLKIKAVILDLLIKIQTFDFTRYNRLYLASIQEFEQISRLENDKEKVDFKNFDNFKIEETLKKEWTAVKHEENNFYSYSINLIKNMYSRPYFYIQVYEQISKNDFTASMSKWETELCEIFEESWDTTEFPNYKTMTGAEAIKKMEKIKANVLEKFWAKAEEYITKIIVGEYKLIYDLVNYKVKIVYNIDKLYDHMARDIERLNDKNVPSDMYAKHYLKKYIETLIISIQSLFEFRVFNKEKIGRLDLKHFNVVYKFIKHGEFLSRASGGIESGTKILNEMLKEMTKKTYDLCNATVIGRTFIKAVSVVHPNFHVGVKIHQFLREYDIKTIKDFSEAEYPNFYDIPIEEELDYKNENLSTMEIIISKFEVGHKDSIDGIFNQFVASQNNRAFDNIVTNFLSFMDDDEDYRDSIFNCLLRLIEKLLYENTKVIQGFFNESHLTQEKLTIYFSKLKKLLIADLCNSKKISDIAKFKGINDRLGDYLFFLQLLAENFNTQMRTQILKYRYEDKSILDFLIEQLVYFIKFINLTNSYAYEVSFDILVVPITSIIDCIIEYTEGSSEEDFQTLIQSCCKEMFFNHSDFIDVFGIFMVKNADLTNPNKKKVVMHLKYKLICLLNAFIREGKGEDIVKVLKDKGMIMKLAYNISESIIDLASGYELKEITCDSLLNLYIYEDGFRDSSEMKLSCEILNLLNLLSLITQYEVTDTQSAILNDHKTPESTKSVYLFLQKITKKLEIKYGDKIIQTFYNIPHKCFVIPKEAKHYLTENLNRENTASKVKSLKEQSEYFLDSIDYNFRLNKEKSPIKHIQGIDFNYVERLNYLFIIIEQILTLLNFNTTTLISNKLKYIPSLGNEVVSYIHIGVISLFISLWSLYNFKLYFNICLKKSKIENPNFFQNLYITVIDCLILNRKVNILIFSVIFQILFLTVGSYMFIVFPVLFIANLSPILTSVINAVASKIRHFASVIVFTYIVIYFFAWTAWYYLYKSFYIQGVFDVNDPNNGNINEIFCTSILQCFLYLIDWGFRSDNWIQSSASYFESIGYFVGLFFFDILFNIFIILILSNIFSGIVVDSFAELRDLTYFIENDKKNICYICQVDRRKGLFNFQKHIEEEHNIWNYCFFFIHLKLKNSKEFNCYESYVWGKLQEENIEWIPLSELTSGE